MNRLLQTYLPFLTFLFVKKEVVVNKTNSNSDKKLGPNDRRIRLTVDRVFVCANENYLVHAGDYVVRFEIDPYLQLPRYVFVDINNGGQTIGASFEYWGALFQRRIVFFI